MKRASKDDREKTVAAWKASGKSIAGFCKGRDITPPTLKRWIDDCIDDDGDEEPAVFLPVRLVERRVEEERAESACVVRMGRDLSVEIRSDTSPVAIERAMKAVAVLCGRI